MIVLSVPNVIKERYHIKLLHSGNELTKNYVMSFFYYLSFLIVGFVLILLAGLRYFVGTDYATYLQYQIPAVASGANSISHSVEYLYSGLIKFGLYLGSTQWIFILTHIVIVVFLILYIINRSSNYVWSMFILFFSTFFNFSLNGMRQSIATAIFLYSTKYISKRKIISYFLCITIAVLFHKSSVVYYPLYLLSYIDLTKTKYTILGAIVIFPVYFLSDFVSQLILKLSYKFDIYTQYINDIYTSTTMFDGTYRILLLFNLIIIICFFGVGIKGEYDGKLLPDGEKLSRGVSIDLSVQYLLLVLLVLSSVIPGTFRLVYMFMPIQMSLIPNMLKISKKNRYKIFFEILLIAAYLTLYSLLILKYNQNETLPYRMITDFNF